MQPIQSANLADLPGAYRVCLRTGDSGADATARFRDPDLLGHVFVGPYIVGEPSLAWVVVDELGVGGYVLGAADTRRFEAWAERAWWPSLRARHPLPAPEDTSADAEIVRLIHAPPRAADAVVAEYPAHLHIDLLERVRGRGLGRAMLQTVLDGLRDRGVGGVHLGVGAGNANAIAFYRHLGFDDVASAADELVMGLRL